LWNPHLGNWRNTGNSKCCRQLWHGKHQRINIHLLQYGANGHQHNRGDRISFILLPVVFSGRSSNTDLGSKYRLDNLHRTDRHKLNSSSHNS